MGGKAVLEVDMGKYKYVELEAGEAEKLIREVVSRLGFESQDVNEAYRVIRNFDAFHEMARKKFKDYIVPSKSMNDMILGRVIIDKLKLVKEGDSRRVGVYFDRRVPEEVIKESLEKLGYKVEVKKLELY